MAVERGAPASTQVAEIRVPHEYYGLTQYDFAFPPDHIETSYSFGEPITRENFTAAMIETFAKSRGSLSAHLTQMEWLRENTGFAFQASFQNYLREQQEKILTPKEQDMIDASFRNVKEHKKLGKSITREAILNNYRGNISALAYKIVPHPTDSIDEPLKPLIAVEELYGMAKGQFLRRLSCEINKGRNSRKSPRA